MKRVARKKIGSKRTAAPRKATGCQHRRPQTVQNGEYETGGSTGYMVTPALLWCGSCGALGREQPGHSRFKWQKPRARKS